MQRESGSGTTSGRSADAVPLREGDEEELDEVELGPRLWRRAGAGIVERRADRVRPRLYVTNFLCFSFIFGFFIYRGSRVECGGTPRLVRGRRSFRNAHRRCFGSGAMALRAACSRLPNKRLQTINLAEPDPMPIGQSAIRPGHKSNWTRPGRTRSIPTRGRPVIVQLAR